MSNHDHATVSVHPTLGNLEDLKRAHAQHEAVAANVAPAPQARDVEPDEVVGAPTLGALDELRFAHHAHTCESAAAPTVGSTSASGHCTCCD